MEKVGTIFRPPHLAYERRLAPWGYPSFGEWPICWQLPADKDLRRARACRDLSAVPWQQVSDDQVGSEQGEVIEQRIRTERGDSLRCWGAGSDNGAEGLDSTTCGA